MSESVPHAFSLPPIDGVAPMVVHLAAEYYPYARTGGLAEAAWGLHRYQHRRGLLSTAIVPLYRVAQKHIRSLEPLGDPYTLHFGERSETFQAWRERDPASETPTVFIQHDGFFDHDGIYGLAGKDFPDNHRRFSGFAAAALAALPRITDGPVVLHAHDWHSALAAVYLRSWWGGDPWYARIPVVMSVHNGGYQGHFGPEIIPDLGLPWSLFTPDALEWYGKTNFLKGGLTHTDVATTVSPAHSRELRTPDGGFGLQQVYQQMGDRFTGILNGIDLETWNPRTDEFIAAHYSRADLSGKAKCKADMQRRFGLPENPDITLIALAGRMVTQKGLTIVVDNEAIFQSKAQFVFLGSGEQRFEDAFARLRASHPERVAFETKFSDELEHVLMAGADIFLMPSQYEPCGLTQMRAQHYGTIPVARRVGGLADTIDDGVTGFLFDAFDERGVLGGLWRAVNEHRCPDAWMEMQRAAMTRDFGWDRVAETYLALYAQAITHAASRRA